MNALAQIIHRRQVLAPLVVDNLQHHAALEALHHLFAHLLDFLGIFGFNLLLQTFGNILVFQRVIGFQPSLNIGMNAELTRQRSLQADDIPFFFHAVGRHILCHQILHHIGADSFGQFADFFAAQYLIAVFVNHLTLFVGDIIIFQYLFTHIEIAAFHFALRAFDLAGQQAVFDRYAALGSKAVQDGGGAIQGKQAQQRVFKRKIETAGTRVALAAGTAAQLVVDTAAFMALGTDNMQTAGFQYALMVGFPAVFQSFDTRLFFFLAEQLIGQDGIALMFHIAAQHNIGTATGHIGGHGNHTGFTRLRYNQRFALVFFGVQYVVRQACLIEQMRHQLGVFNGGGTHQHRLTALVTILNVFNHRFVLLFGSAENLVVVVFTLNRAVGRNNHRFQAINALELKSLGIGGTGHAGQLFVQTEIVLEGNRSQRLVFALDFHPFFGFHRLVQAIRPAAAVHQTAGVLVDNHNFAFFNHIVLVFVE